MTRDEQRKHILQAAAKFDVELVDDLKGKIGFRGTATDIRTALDWMALNQDSAPPQRWEALSDGYEVVYWTLGI